MNWISTNIENICPPDTEPERQFYFMAECRNYILKKSQELGRPLTYITQTFGCQMNAKDSEKLSGILEEIGYQKTDTEKADFVVYNTCTVRENANSRVYGRIGYLGNLKSKNPGMLIALCGCMMQEGHVVEKIRTSYRFVDIVCGTHNLYKMAELIFTRLFTNAMTVDVWEEAGQIVEELPSERKYPFKAGVNIMYGCDNFCSYCIVPYVRGRERSRKPEEILAEVRKLAQDGVVELMLLGQNVNSYGKNLEKSCDFPTLLASIAEIEGIQRIRFMTSHPKDLSDALIAVLRDTKKICRHLHLPLQSGSSRILKAMNRGYTKEDYLELVHKIRSAMPDISLTTDIIVGFPGETQEDFLETLDVVEQVRFDGAYTFLYSRRTNTPAADMEQVEESVAKERFTRLLRQVQRLSAEAAGRYEGKVMEVLAEEVNAQDPQMLTGRLDTNLVVHFRGEKEQIGQFHSVQLEENRGFYFIGKKVSVL